MGKFVRMTESMTEPTKEEEEPQNDEGSQSCKWDLDGEILVICEGKDDKFFLESLMQAHGLLGFQIGHAHECNGKKGGGRSGFGPAIKGLPGFTKYDKLRGVAIVTDNDNEKAVAEVITDLKNYGYSPTKSPYVGEIKDSKPLIIILIPNQEQHGTLETLCLPLLYCTWSNAKECVEDYLEHTGAVRWTNKKEIPKAKVQCIISGNYDEDPYKGLGRLFQKGILCALDPHFDKLADTFRRFDEIVKTGRF
jgi:hypothetical protein